MSGDHSPTWSPISWLCDLQNQCCGAYGPEDWDLNVYFNCSGASYSREKCGVPFSCCVPDPAVSRCLSTGVLASLRDLAASLL